MAVKNETGNRYERILVGGRAPNNNRGDAQWYCHCDCGTDFIAKGISLRAGHTKSCGCLQKDIVRAQGLKNTADLMGKYFGKLEVVERIIGDKDNRGKWRCICECGGEAITTSDKLISGHTTSCGCVMSKQVYIIGKYLTDKGITFSKEYTFANLKTDKNYVVRFDFAIIINKQLKFLLEFDGIQHFDEKNQRWSERLIMTDTLKNEYCNTNNITLYRIAYNQDTIKELNNILMKEGLL